MGARTNNPKATLLGDTLMDATGRWLDGKFQKESFTFPNGPLVIHDYNHNLTYNLTSII